MLISFFRTLILYALIVLALRVMGKRQVGQLEPSELVVTMMISDLATIPMGRVSIPLLHGVIPIVTLIVAEATVSYLNLKSRRLRKLVSGTPAVLIRDGKVNEKELERLRMNIDDLMEELRSGGNADITSIAYAIFETNGTISVILKADERTVCPKDLGQTPKYKGLPFLFICDGKINDVALKAYQKDENWLKKELDKHKTKRVEDVFFAGVNESGDFFMQRKENV